MAENPAGFPLLRRLHFGFISFILTLSLFHHAIEEL